MVSTTVPIAKAINGVGQCDYQTGERRAGGRCGTVRGGDVLLPLSHAAGRLGWTSGVDTLHTRGAGPALGMIFNMETIHMFNVHATAMSITIALCGSAVCAQVEHAPRQERVPDFGRFVPEGATATTPQTAPEVVLERVTTAVPWSRGMTEVDGALIVLSRGRHRGDGGVDQSLVDQAGTIWRIDTSVSERVIPGAWAGEAVRDNATVFARPTSPPFHLYDYSVPSRDDYMMTRPYCALAFDAESQNLFVCAYAGAELPDGFRKHPTDAVYRYDLRDESWHVVDQHDPTVVPREVIGNVISNAYYPHHDPATNPPPHGWVNGANGCIGVGRYLYVPAKDNHLVVRYDLDEIRERSDAPAPASRPVLGPEMVISYPGGEETMEVLGPSSVAEHGDYLYIGYRTSSIVVRVPLDNAGDIVRMADGRAKGELIAVFEPWDPEAKRSGNLYDLDVSVDGELFVSLGTEGKVWRITPDPERPFYGNDRSARPTTAPAFLDMSALVGRRTGCNNIYVDEAGAYLYVSSRNNDTGAGDICGTIYRVRLK